MRTVLLILIAIALAACTKEEITYTQQNVQCESTQVGETIQVNCPNGMFYQFNAPRDGIDGKDGLDGINGQNGLNAQGITILDPCGDMAGQVDEVVLVFPGNVVLAWYQNVGFAVLQTNTTYQTTDLQQCIFQVTAQGTLL